MSLKEYQRKRDFGESPEPSGSSRHDPPANEPLRFVVQHHHASKKHYDFRLEWGGTLKSWAVPKGPSLNPTDQRFAAFVEDHPLDYIDFEGIIPRGNYGAGTVMVWDHGTFVERQSKGRSDSEERLPEKFSEGKITVVLEGQKLKGEFALIRLKDADEKSWILLKKRDEHASFKRDITERSRSAKTGRTMEEIAQEAESKGEVWVSSRPDHSDEDSRVEPARDSNHRTPLTQKEKLGPEYHSVESEEREPPPKLKAMSPTSHRRFARPAAWWIDVDRGGIRTLASIVKGRVSLHSGRGMDIKGNHPEVARQLRGVEPSVLLDGEIIDQTFYAFDLLHLEEKNLRGLSLQERRSRLAALELPPSIQIARESADPNSEAEALIYKDPTSHYESGPSSQWIKFPVEKPESRDDAKEKVADSGPIFTHRDKVYFPEDGITKGDLIDYYHRISSYLLPHLQDRPLSLNRHPNGIHGESFYQKDMVGYVPSFAKTVRIGGSERSINYLVCNNQNTLLYMINLGCIEVHPWLSRVHDIEHPDFCVIDLDPSEENSFDEVIEVALACREELEPRGLRAFLKTSGATGLHLFLPTQGRLDFDQSRDLALEICRRVLERFPKLCSIERSPSKRRGKIYLDCFQNRNKQTIASVYCVRPRTGATVSTPLHWDELQPGLKPSMFRMENLPRRLEEVGDLWKAILDSPQQS